MQPLRLLGGSVASLIVALASAAPSAAGEHRLQVSGGTIDVSITGTPVLSEKSLLKWMDTGARAVSAYFGRYPVPMVRLRVRTGGGGRVGSGMTMGGRAPWIKIAVGHASREKDLRDDWVLTHEMVHLGFPDLTSDDTWAEEGLATYVEPWARARVGAYPEDEVWADLIEGLPQGLPRRGGRGLHGTDDWGRTYWGGALFWLIADVRIREHTRNRKGLPDALAAILEAGGDVRAKWDLRRTLSTADTALGLTVLSDLYRELGQAPGHVDLDGLWRRLGVRAEHGRVTYDDAAPLADVRRAMMNAPRAGW